MSIRLKISSSTIRAAIAIYISRAFQSEGLSKLARTDGHRALRILAQVVAFLLITAAVAQATDRAPLDALVAQSLRMFDRLNPGNAALENKALAMLIFPRVGKGDRPGLNPEIGDGVLKIKGGADRRYSIQTPTRSPTLGVAYHEVVILFMTEGALHKFQSSLSWVVDDNNTGMAIVVAGQTGVYDEAKLNKPTLGFVFGEEGLLDDLFLKGCAIRPVK